MVPDESKACVGMEYFCFQGDDLWEMDDDALVELGQAASSAKLGLVDPAKVEKGYVTRVPLAYPMYDPDYGERVDAIRGWLETHRQPPAGRPQRAAPLQQLRSLDAHRDPRGGEHRSRHRPRHLGGQRRVRLPRDRRAGGAARTAARPRRRRCASRWSAERGRQLVWIAPLWTFVRWKARASDGTLSGVWRASRTGPRARLRDEDAEGFAEGRWRRGGSRHRPSLVNERVGASRGRARLPRRVPVPRRAP